MDINILANGARKSLSKYCIEECCAYCCRKGYLAMDERQAHKVCGKRYDELLKSGKLKKLKDGRYTVFMGDPVAPCPALGKDLLCKVHSSKLRPGVCADFPIFIVGKNVIMVHRCPAVKEGRMYGFEMKMKQVGCRIIHSAPMLDSEIYNLD